MATSTRTYAITPPLNIVLERDTNEVVYAKRQHQVPSQGLCILGEGFPGCGDLYWCGEHVGTVTHIHRRLNRTTMDVELIWKVY